jgi:glutamate-1-semialdehyde aminotransferase
LEALFQEFPKQVAAVILAPEMVLPHDPDIFRSLLRIAHANGALFVMDEVKTGLRIAPNSVSERVGINPDLITVSKALANGWPVAVTLGRREVMQCAEGMHYSATFHGDTTAMAAARVTQEIVRTENVQSRLERLGQQLIDGLNAISSELGAPAIAYGEPLPAMPFFHFTHSNNSTNAQLTIRFFREVLAGGILLHPRHMWFLSNAHTAADVDRALEVCRRALKLTLSTVG